MIGFILAVALQAATPPPPEIARLFDCAQAFGSHVRGSSMSLEDIGTAALLVCNLEDRNLADAVQLPRGGADYRQIDIYRAAAKGIAQRIASRPAQCSDACETFFRARGIL